MLLIMANNATPVAIEAAVHEYRGLLPSLEIFRGRLESLLRALLSDEGRDVHQIQSRCKGTEEFAEKIGRKGYQDPLREMTDLIGLRIIMYYDADVTFAAGLIDRELIVDPALSVDWRMPAERDRFGYASNHLICTLDARRAELPEWRLFADIRVEIQLRTVLQHAWAVVSHQLGYKSVPGLAPEGERRLASAAALLEMADREFEAIRAGEDQARTLQEGLTDPTMLPATKSTEGTNGGQ